LLRRRRTRLGGEPVSPAMSLGTGGWSGAALLQALGPPHGDDIWNCPGAANRVIPSFRSDIERERTDPGNAQA